MSRVGWTNLLRRLTSENTGRDPFAKVPEVWMTSSAKEGEGAKRFSHTTTDVTGDLRNGEPWKQPAGVVSMYLSGVALKYHHEQASQFQG